MDRELIKYIKQEISSCEFVKNIGVIQEIDKNIILEFDICVFSGGRWNAEGQSPSGIKPIERVRFDFDEFFPFSAPIPSYRTELGRQFPHVQPYKTFDGRPVPCICEYSPTEFIASKGYAAYVYQFRDWLQRAASSNLIDFSQGWEPMRLDANCGSVILDISHWNNRVNSNTGDTAGHELVVNQYGIYNKKNQLSIPLSRFIVTSYKVEEFLKNNKKFSTVKSEPNIYGVGLSLICWHNIQKGKKIFNEYAPNEVNNFHDLMNLADYFGMKYKISNELRRITRLSRDIGNDKPRNIPFLIVLAIHRPCVLIGSNSDIEMLAFLTFLDLSKKSPIEHSAKVYTLSIRDIIGSEIGKKLSGVNACNLTWISIGAGSLGSKIALHLAKAGIPPIGILDKSLLQPHNYVRHGLLPPKDYLYDEIETVKSFALSRAIHKLSRFEPKFDTCDIAKGEETLLSWLQPTKGQNTFILNTTASTNVREFLSTRTNLDARIVDCEMFSNANLGVMRIEGKDKNPNCSELASSFYSISMSDNKLSEYIYGTELATIELGQGCGSHTMIASDAKISFQASYMANAFQELPKIINKNSGQIKISILEDQNISSKTIDIPPFIRLNGPNGWVVSIASDVHEKIQNERQTYSNENQETGGVIVGRVIVASKSIHIMSLVEAPTDSKRECNYFELGVQGLSEARDVIINISKGTFDFIGTWHSHLGKSEPSKIDECAANKIANGTTAPKLLLVVGSDGYSLICKNI